MYTPKENKQINRSFSNKETKSVTWNGMADFPVNLTNYSNLEIWFTSVINVKYENILSIANWKT